MIFLMNKCRSSMKVDIMKQSLRTMSQNQCFCTLICICSAIQIGKVVVYVSCHICSMLKAPWNEHNMTENNCFQPN